MNIAELQAQPNWVLSIVADDDRVGRFDVRSYLQYEGSRRFETRPNL